MNYYEKHLFVIMLIGLSMIAIMGALMIHTCTAEMAEIEQFLMNDTTDQQNHSIVYSCGHFSRDLSRNASEYNITIGSIILSNHPVFRGRWNSHIVNYVMVNDTIVIIDPQTDYVFAMNPGMSFDRKSFTFYRLYPDGTQVPSNWIYNLAPTGVII